MRTRSTARRGLPAALLVLALTLAPDAAADACGDAKHAAAAKRGAASRAPLVVGDSVLLGAVRQVAAAGFEVDTRGCRQIDEGLNVLRARRRARTLPRLVVLALGSNGSLGLYDIRRAMEIVGPDRVLGLVTPREPGKELSARAMRAAARQFPDRVRLLDWLRYSAGRRGWFAGDGIHLGHAGARGMARLLRRALALAVAPLCP